MSKLAEKAKELKAVIETTPGDSDVADLERLKFRLSDAIREGSLVSEQANGWGDGERACALHAAVTSATARGYM